MWKVASAAVPLSSSALMLSLVAHAQPLKSEPCGTRQIVYCLVSSDVNLVLPSPPVPLHLDVRRLVYVKSDIKLMRHSKF